MLAIIFKVDFVTHIFRLTVFKVIIM
jgi:hypothetical protein